MARANAFWPTAVLGEADSVNSVSASACHIGGGPKGVSPGQKALLHGKLNICDPVMQKKRIVPLKHDARGPYNKHDRTLAFVLACESNVIMLWTDNCEL